MNKRETKRLTVTRKILFPRSRSAYGVNPLSSIYPHQGSYEDEYEVVVDIAPRRKVRA